MRLLFDTSVVIAALLKDHLHHSRARRWLDRIVRREHTLVLADRTAAEAYAMLSTFPGPPRPTPQQAWSMVSRVMSLAQQVVALSPTETLGTVRELSERLIEGRIVYDALIVRAAIKAKADRILTLNLKHFRRLWTGDHSMIQEP